MKKRSIGLLLGLSLTIQVQAQNLSPYSLKTGREVTLLGAGVASYGTAYAFNRDLKPLTIDGVQNLNRANVPSLDRSALDHYSPKAARLSDLTLGTGIGLTGLVILSAKAPVNAIPGRIRTNADGSTTEPSFSFVSSELFTVGVMYVETMLLTNGVKSTVKNAVERTRPLAYNPAVPLDEKLDKDTQRSFYSGHASNAFATAVFAAEIFRHYHPTSKAKPWVWVSSLGLASGTAYLRYEAGQHFPSDLLVGAAVGSLAGWGIPKLHENRHQSASLSVTPWSNGLASGVSFRWSLSSPSFVTE
ncbi:phosphatase PAP2 family protein [Fibrella sp. USSR17]